MCSIGADVPCATQRIVCAVVISISPVRYVCLLLWCTAEFDAYTVRSFLRSYLPVGVLRAAARADELVYAKHNIAILSSLL